MLVEFKLIYNWINFRVNGLDEALMFGERSLHGVSALTIEHQFNESRRPQVLPPHHDDVDPIVNTWDIEGEDYSNSSECCYFQYICRVCASCVVYRNCMR